MVEWFKAAVLKTAVAVMSPGVRIPLSPPLLFYPQSLAYQGFTEESMSKILILKQLRRALLCVCSRFQNGVGGKSSVLLSEISLNSESF